MLISHKHKFIFIHIYKNAGMSITTALMPLAANPIQLEAHRALSKYFNISRLDPTPYRLHRHMRASEVISKLGKDTFDSYFSFAVVRNPWDWLVSIYTYKYKTRHDHHHDLIKDFSSFDEYIRWRCSGKWVHQKDFIFDESGKQLVSFIGRFENLDEDFQYICSKIGASISLPKVNVSKTKPYQAYYNEETKELVRQAFAPDIALFGYDFE